MYNFDECKNRTAVNNKAREIAFNILYEAYCDVCGAENVSIVDNNTISVALGLKTITDGTQSEVCVELKPVVKNYEERKTDSGKTFEAYERLTTADTYEIKKTEKEKKAEENARIKAEKKARDEKARAEKKKAKE